MAERNDISGLLAFIGREGDWRERLQDVVAAHLMPALEEFEIDQDGLAPMKTPQSRSASPSTRVSDLLCIGEVVHAS